MKQTSLYLQNPICREDIISDDELILKSLFIGVDLAPIDSLETGFAIIDRGKKLFRMDKLNDDKQILSALDNLSAVENVVIALDVPKSLNYPGKWRQQELKMHPLRQRVDVREDVTDRFSKRAWNFYKECSERGFFIFNFFPHHAKLRYNMRIPYKGRTPQGCKAMQALIGEKLGIRNIPTNLAPSSVLDAMIASYTAWASVFGEDEEDFQFYTDKMGRLYLDPIKVSNPLPRRRRLRNYRAKRYASRRFKKK